MNGIWILLLLILIAALPVIIVFFWFRKKKSPVSLPWFLVALAAGIVSLLAAALIQNFLPSFTGSGRGRPWLIFYDFFIRIALVEEASRLVTIIPFFRLGFRRRNMDRAFCGALGFAAGLGFATLESAFYGIADINVALLRALAAAPLHGACGIRVSLSFFYFNRYPVKAFFLFIFAVLIHGVYNMMILNPALPSVLAILIAIIALLSSLPFLKPDNDTLFAPNTPSA